jgi:hypothetical protein
MSGKRNWDRDRERRRAQEQGTASLYRGMPSTRPKAHVTDEHAGSGKPDLDSLNSQALWAFMRDLARAELKGLPTPIIPRQALERIGVTSQSVAVAWIRRNPAYAAIRQRMIEQGQRDS